METINILVLGSDAVGKSSFIKRIVTGDFKNEKPKHVERLLPVVGNGVSHELCSTTFHTTYGLKRVNFHENVCSVPVDFIWILFSFDSYESYEQSLNLLDQVEKKDALVVCGNKVDLVDMSNPIKPTIPFSQIKINAPYFSVSAKSMFNLEKPILYVLRSLYGSNLNLEVTVL